MSELVNSGAVHHRNTTIVICGSRYYIAQSHTVYVPVESSIYYLVSHLYAILWMLANVGFIFLQSLSNNVSNLWRSHLITPIIAHTSPSLLVCFNLRICPIFKFDKLLCCWQVVNGHIHRSHQFFFVNNVMPILAVHKFLSSGSKAGLTPKGSFIWNGKIYVISYFCFVPYELAIDSAGPRMYLEW